MADEQDKKGGFSQVTHPKKGLSEAARTQRSRRRDLELAKTMEGPPPSAALKPTKSGVDPLAQTGAYPSVPPSDGPESDAAEEPEEPEEPEEDADDDASDEQRQPA